MPERVMEWLLLFIPPDVFELLLRRLGFDAKLYALAACIVGMLVGLAALGSYILRKGWSVGVIVATGLALWLFVMLVIMPLTSAGLFARDLLVGTRAAIGGYLAVGLTYACVLALARIAPPARTWLHALRRDRGVSALGPNFVQRRTLIGLVGGAAAAYAGTALAARFLPEHTDVASVVLADPQAPFPSGGIEPQNPHPNVVGTPPTAGATSEPKAPAAPPVEAATSPNTRVQPALPEPIATRELAREKDGAVVPGGRRPGEVASAITRNADFYIVTKNAGGDPAIHPQDWHLLVDGEVERSFQIDYATLRQLPSVEVTKTLECISNMVAKPELAPFGAELISTAAWRGARVRDIFGLVGGPKPSAVSVAVLGADEYTTALPLAVIMDPATLLVYEMNGEVLPREHGYPARLLVPDHYGMKNPKWVVGLRPMQREFLDWYGQRHWSKTGLLRTMTRIDAPTPGATLEPGDEVLAGVAYAGTRGIQKVEFSVDGGATWQGTTLLDAPTPGQDRWVRWRGEFDMARGAAALLARATDSTGELQVQTFSLPEPDGGTGWPSIQVRAGEA